MEFLFRRAYRGPLKAAVLDWAGTTVDYGCCAPAIVFVDVFKRHGVEITDAEARAPMGAEKRQHILEITEMPRVAAAWEAAHGTPCTPANVDAMYAVVTEDYGMAQAFVAGIDSAVTLVNASTRFTDGEEFGFGAEIGISTQKLHVRGPMGLEALTSERYVLYGDGHVR